MSERENHIQSQTRTAFGKGAARRLRAAGKIPAVIYGHGSETRHVELPGHELSLIVRKANALIDLDVDGEQQLVLVKDVQKDPVRQVIEHVDLVVVRKGEKVEANVAIHLEGSSVSGTNVLLENAAVQLSVEATSIPEFIVVSVEGLEAGTLIHAGEIALPAGAELLSDPDLLLVHIVIPRAVVEPTAEEIAAEAEASGGSAADSSGSAEESAE
jgi:large subunit ribosomal protein L25